MTVTMNLFCANLCSVFLVSLVVVMCAHVSANENTNRQLAGGLTSYRKVDAELDAILAKLKPNDRPRTLSFVPLAYATQVVSGIKYRVFCETNTVAQRPRPRMTTGNAEIVTSTMISQKGNAMITFYVDLEGNPNRESLRLAYVKRNEGLAGGYTHYRKPEPSDIEIFAKVERGADAAKFTPFAVATQVVAGMNYRFLCEVEQSDDAPISEFSLGVVTIYASLDGKVEVTPEALEQVLEILQTQFSIENAGLPMWLMLKYSPPR